MSARITAVETFDVRFPMTATRAGSDAMNPDPDYSAAYLLLHTDAEDLRGHGMVFTLGRGTEVQVAAIRALAPHLIGADLDELRADMAGFWRRLAGDTQLRWLGPEKGMLHMATAALVNAVWDLHAQRAGEPLWRLLARMTPEQIVALVDFRYIEDALSREQALALLHERAAGRGAREARLLADGIPAYTTSPGWLGYDDETLRRLVREAVDDGFHQVKLKVGAELADDMRRCMIAREELGPDRALAVDANQCWGVQQAIDWIGALERFDLRWVEEPTSPDDVLGYAAIARAHPGVPLASGENVHNRVMFKQLLQTGGIGACQLDACRVGGVNEVLAVLLLAARFGVPVCPHAGGIGLPEHVQHIAALDYVLLGGDLEGRVVEYVDQLREHVAEPADVRGGRYRAPLAPGYGARLRPEALEHFAFPEGPAWTGDAAAA